MESVGPVESGNYRPLPDYPQSPPVTQAPTESARIGRQASFIPTIPSLSTKLVPCGQIALRKGRELA